MGKNLFPPTKWRARMLLDHGCPRGTTQEAEQEKVRPQRRPQALQGSGGVLLFPVPRSWLLANALPLPWEEAAPLQRTLRACTCAHTPHPTPPHPLVQLPGGCWIW